MVAFRGSFVSMLPSSRYWSRLESLSGPVVNPDPCVLGGVAHRKPSSLLHKADWRTASYRVRTVCFSHPHTQATAAAREA
jgi:hypothetical protein